MMNLVILRRKVYSKFYYFLVSKDYANFYNYEDGYERVGQIELPKKIIDVINGNEVEIKGNQFEVKMRNINKEDYLTLIENDSYKEYLLCKMNDIPKESFLSPLISFFKKEDDNKYILAYIKDNSEIIDDFEFPEFEDFTFIYFDTKEQAIQYYNKLCKKNNSDLYHFIIKVKKGNVEK